MYKKWNQQNKSPIKVTLNHPIYRQKENNVSSKPINSDQIFYCKRSQQKQSSHTSQQQIIPKIHKKIRQTNKALSKSHHEITSENNTKYKKNHNIQYSNGQYYGKISKKNCQPQGLGIVIDDEFNFFLSSNWLNKASTSSTNFQMNGLTFIKMANQTILYGTWIGGTMKGHQSINIGGNLCFFMETKQSDPSKWASPFVVLNYSIQAAYIVELQQCKNQSLRRKPLNKTSNTDQYNFLFDFPQLQIIDRIPFSKLEIDYSLRNSKKGTMNPNSIMSQLKIPQYMFSPMQFLVYFSQNNQCMKVNFIDNSDRYFFIDLENNESQQNESGPERQREMQNYRIQSFHKKKSSINIKNTTNFSNIKGEIYHQTKHKIGIIMQYQSCQSKAIGKFNEKFQLHGIGVSSYSKNQHIVGVFKEDMIVQELKSYPMKEGYSFNKSDKKIRNILKNQHMKSLNYCYDTVYFSNVLKILSFVEKIVSFVEIFEIEFSKKFRKAQDTNQNSEDSMDKISLTNKYINNENYNEKMDKIVMMTVDNSYKNFEQPPLQRKYRKRSATGFIVSRSPSVSPLKNSQDCHQKTPPRTYRKQNSSHKKFSPMNRNLHLNIYASLEKDDDNDDDSFSDQFNKSTSKNKNSKQHQNPQYFKKSPLQQQNNEKLDTVRYEKLNIRTNAIKYPTREIFWKKK